MTSWLARTALRIIREALRRLPDVLWRNAIGLAFLACSIVPLIAAYEAEALFSRPQPLSLTDAIASAGSGPTRYVTLDGQPDAATRIYNIPFSGPDALPYTGQLFSRFSPADGIPINAPDAVVEPHYYVTSLIGARARVDGPLTPFGYVEQLHVLYRARWYFFAVEGVTDTVRVMARFTESNNPFVDRDARFAKQLEDWLAEGHWSGSVRLSPPQDIDMFGLPPEAKDGFVVDTTEPLQRDGMFVYAPLRDNDGKIWMRAPIDFPDWDKTKFSGLLLPAGGHRFALQGGDPVALLDLDPAAIRGYLDEQWRTEWAIAVVLAGLLAFAGVLFIGVNEGRRLLFVPGVPDYLLPFAPYLAPEPVNRSFTIAALGATMTVFGGLLAVVAFMTIVSAIRAAANNTELLNAHVSTFIWTWLGFLLVGGIGTGLYQLGRGIWSRGATQLLRDDKRSPVVYLRSFRADRRIGDTEHKLVEKASTIGPVVAVGEPAERFPPFGAARLYVDHAHWHDVVASLVAVAQLVIFRIGDTEGFWWELSHAAEKVDPGKVLIWIPDADRKHFTDAILSRINAVLSHPLPPLRQSRGAEFISFGPGWTSQWIRSIPGAK
jgi:hypothetical protein